MDFFKSFNKSNRVRGTSSPADALFCRFFSNLTPIPKPGTHSSKRTFFRFFHQNSYFLSIIKSFKILIRESNPKMIHQIISGKVVRRVLNPYAF